MSIQLQRSVTLPDVHSKAINRIWALRYLLAQATILNDSRAPHLSFCFVTLWTPMACPQHLIQGIFCPICSKSLPFHSNKSQILNNGLQGAAESNTLSPGKIPSAATPHSLRTATRASPGRFLKNQARRGISQDRGYQCRHSHIEPLLTHASTGDPPTPAGAGSSFLWMQLDPVKISTQTNL